MPAIKTFDHTTEALFDILRSHVIDPTTLRTDNFEVFFQARHKALLNRIEKAMGKFIIFDTNQLKEAEAFEYEEE
ncbi:hypothetical protein [Fischerella sp. PCC 9605]|uniref:hypothetical protein n=1 Tax=Fischerella sp. PCC 9605 TaxID=1173024 RepID=UPI00047B18AE|nr:hypothetical protein [Fischerella sp. PCC 9605]